MSLLDQASLVLVPSAYKTGEVLVQKPLPTKFSDETGNYDGNDPTTSANLTFTRNSNATRVNADGLVEKVRQNVLLQSNDFSSASWVKVDTSVTSGQADKDGGTNAWLLAIASATGFQTLRQQSIWSVTGYNTFSVYAKAGALNWMRINFGSGSTYFNLSTGTIGIDNSIGASIEAVGNGYYRCIVPFNASSTFVFIYPATGDGNVSQSSGSIYIQNAQLETGDIATDWIETASAAVSVGPTANVPRLDYSGGCPSLLLEPQRTNLALWSEAFDNAGWSKLGISVTANNTTSPSGYQDADKLVANAGSGTRVVYQGILPAGVSTTSVYAKAGEFGGIVIASGQYGAFFNLTTGEYRRHYGSAPASYSITSTGSGWYRCTVTINSPTTDNLYIGPNDNYSNTLGVTGNGTDGIYVWGAQLEAGSYATSYIPTLGASVTRLADAAYKTGISSLIGTEGSIFVDFDLLQLDDFGGIVDLTTAPPSSSTRILLWENTGNQLQANFGTFGSAISLNSVTIGRHKALITYSASRFKFFVDGVKIGQTTPSTAPTGLSELTFVCSSGGVNFQKKNIYQTLLFTSALSDADAITLTTL